MDIHINLQQLLSTVVSTTVLLGIIGFLGRKWIEAWFARRLATHDAALKLRNEEALALVEHELSLRAVRGTRLISKQITIVATVYQGLEKVHEAVKLAALPSQHTGRNIRDELIVPAGDQLNKLASYFYERGIWLDKSTRSLVHDFIQLTIRLLRRMQVLIDASGGHIPLENRQEWAQLVKQVQTEIPEMRSKLDAEFERILGVSSDDARLALPPGR